MSEQIETDDAATRDALGVVTEVFAAQAIVLDEMFYRAAKDGVSPNPGSRAPLSTAFRHLTKALKAQGQCRATLNILLALQAAAHDAKKFSNLDKRTNENGNSLHDQ